MQMLKPGYDLQYFRTKCLLRDVQEKITKCVFWSFVTRFFQFEIVIFGQVTFCAGGRYFAKASVGGRLGRDYMCCQHNWNFKLLARVMLSWSCQRGERITCVVNTIATSNSAPPSASPTVDSENPRQMSITFTPSTPQSCEIITA